MVSYYLDTSALLKRYVEELGSTWIRTQVSEATLLVSSELVIVEAVSAFNRRAREGGLSLTEYRRVRDILYEDCRVQYQIVPVARSIIALACTLLENHQLRGYDAMHLATALTVKRSLQKRELAPLTFVCADDHLNIAASAEGLRVDNPLDYA
ncbi:MAG: type II toxin-antitoxin system VapC family toxin [Anaerolineae bacterium]|nr:type II toxin-antitoxin system VapC family toxin [Anaerolineae bacterium]